MEKAKQITVWVENRQGQLARIASALADAKVNITAFAAYGAGNESPIRLLVKNPVKARKALVALGARLTEEDVLRLTLPDKPGQLAVVSRRLAEQNINVEYAYETVAAGARKADLVLSVSDLAGALRALRGLHRP
jgi:hypothetical protein